MPSPPIILYDGECNMCNSTVQWVLKRDRKSVFRFASLTSRAAHLALQQVGVARESLPDSMVVIDSAHVYTQSEAVLAITEKLGGVWRVFSVAKIIPRAWRDAIYAFVAKHRKQIMSNRAKCMLPTPEMQSRFLDRDEQRPASTP